VLRFEFQIHFSILSVQLYLASHAIDFRPKKSGFKKIWREHLLFGTWFSWKLS